MRPFGCPVTILNTLDHFGKFQGKVDEGFLVRYSVCSKAFRVFNSRTRIVHETLHVNFMENKPNVAGSGPAWLFDIDSLTRTMNYHPIIAENQTNSHAGLQDIEKAREEVTHTYVLFPVLSDGSTSSQNKNKDALVDGKEHDDDIQKSVSPDIHSISSGAQTRKQGDKTDNKDKGKSPVVTITGFRDLNAEFKENKARLVAQGHTQEEGIDYEEVFAPVARIETIRLFFSLCLLHGLSSVSNRCQKSISLWHYQRGVYVCQPPGFKDPKNPDKVYKVVKALYGLHQALRSWYETLATYLLETLCKSFEKLMKDKFQMSSMGELTFFLGLQVKQKKDGIFTSQDKYVAEILKKFGLSEGKSANTLIDAEKALLKDSDGEDVDVHTYSQENLSILEGKALLGLMVSKRFTL
nr:putative ribonuclease H-like domain-containing protein [Tanacetum cinerariifolium]